MSKKLKTENVAPQKRNDFVFGKNNYQLFLIGIAIVIIGYLLMTGTEDILDFRKITLAPIVVVAGFIVVMIGILKKPKED